MAGNPSSRLRTLLVIAVCVLAVEALGAAAARITGPGALNPWYMALVKPELQPSEPLLALIWIALYAMLGAALGLVIAAPSVRGKGLAVFLFVVQMAMSLAWLPLFMSAHRMLDAFWLTTVILLISLLTAWRFWSIRRVAGGLMLIWLVWLGFAAMLNWQIVQLNPDGGPTISMGAEAAIPPQQE